jgi:hypothetical protein
MDDDFLLLALEEKLEPAELVEILGLEMVDLWDTFYDVITQTKKAEVLDALRLD